MVEFKELVGMVAMAFGAAGILFILAALSMRVRSIFRKTGNKDS